MKIKSCMAALLAITVAAPVLFAGDKAYKGVTLTPGKYMATMTPSVDAKTADKIERQLGHIEGLTAIVVLPGVLKFTVVENGQVSLSHIMNMLHASAHDTTVTTPVPEPTEPVIIVPPTRP